MVLRGKVFTGAVCGSYSFAECVAFSRESGRICFVGSYAELRDRTERKELERAVWHRTYNVHGLILPAFHDAHCHPFGAGNRNRQWDNPRAKEEDDQFRAAALDLSECKSWDEVKAACQEAISKRSEAAELDKSLLAEKCGGGLVKRCRNSIANELDSISAGQPLVLLVGAQAEAVAVNHAAMRALSAKMGSWNFGDSDKRIHRTSSGEASGYFHGSVWAMRFALLSPASVASQGLRGLRDGLQELPKHGIVACTDAFVFEDRIPCYELAFAEDSKRRLPRTNLALGFKDDWSPDHISEIVERAPVLRQSWEDTNFRFCLREAKVEVDHGRTISWEEAKLASLVNNMVAANFSMHMHVFYAQAAQHSLSLLLAAENCRLPDGAKASAKCKAGPALRPERNNRRHKLAHVFELRPDDIRTVCKTPFVHIVYQPMWFRHAASYDEEAVAAHVELVQNGGQVCYGSDWDISDVNPLQGLRAILSRDGVYAKEKPWPERVAEAIRLYTLDAARAMWLDDCSGALEVGKFADICVLDKDLFEMPEKDFCFDIDKETRFTLWYEGPPVKVMATFSRGFCIFQRQPEEKEEPAEATTVLERFRSVPLSTRAGDLDKLTDDEFLCGMCACDPSPGLLPCC